MAVHDRYKSYQADQRAFFDALITEEWDSYFSEAWDQTRRYELEELFARIQPKVILDVGCGCGFHDPEMAARPFVQKVDAIDYSAESIKKADEAYPHPNVSRHASDFASFKPTQKYELVVSFQVFEHLDNTDEYFEFCRDVVADKGHIAIFTPNRLRYTNFKRKLLGKPLELLDPQHFTEYTVSDINALGAKFGFKPFASFGYGFEGLGLAERLGHMGKLRLGARLPFLAHGICVILSR